MKNKIVFKSQKDFVKWVTVSNMFAKSRIMPMVALKQFNSLKANQRTNIKKAFEEYDQKRRIKIPKGEIDSAWTISVMVDAHIIATEYNVDPLTVIMCLKSTRHFPACSHNFPKAGEARFQGLSRLFRLLGKFPYLGESRRILMAVSSKTSSKTRFYYAATRRISSAAVQPSIWA